MIFKVSISEENWKTKYRYKDEDPVGTFRRVANAVAAVERSYGADEETVKQWAEKFFHMLVKHDENGEPIGLKTTPGGRITANLGTEYKKVTPWNCFIESPVTKATISYSKPVRDKDMINVVIETGDTPDNLSNIFLTLLESAETLKSEGGIGLNFGFIRPRGSLIKGVGIRHPGVVSYMELWDKMSEIIVKGDNDGYSDKVMNHLEDPEYLKRRVEKVMPRKGAMMAILPIWHPDVEEFIRAKQTPGKLTKFNISVLIDDAFMQAVEKDDFYDLHFNGKVYKRVKARDMYDLIMTSTYNRAEPGVVFLDNANRINPLLYLGPETATNPCGEVPGSAGIDAGYRNYAADYLKPYLDDVKDFIQGRTTVCLLGSVNLTMYVNKDRSFDYDALCTDIQTFARFLENINEFTGMLPLPAYRWAVENIRQYGMGFNGIGSTLFMLGHAYNSKEAEEFLHKIHFVRDDETLRASALLAKERGPFPMFSEEYLNTPYFREYCKASEESKELVRQHGVRNAKRLTNPPLGNTSVICNNISNGIEPVFSFGYERTVMSDAWPEGMNQDNVKDLLPEAKIGDATIWRGEYNGRTWYYEPHNRGLCFIEPIQDYGYRWVLEHYPEDIENNAPYLVTAQSLSVSDHVKVQAICQGYCDQSISKTASVPNDYPFEDFKNLYMDAWKSGLVGFTTYRSGTMEEVLSVGSNAKPVKAVTYLDALKSCDCINDDAELTDEQVIVKNVKLPEEFDNGPTTIVKREGNKYYIHLSYLKDCKDHPVALWISSNNMQDGEYVSLNRATRSLQRLLIEKGVDMDLVLEQVEKVKDNPHHERLGKMIGMALRHNICVKEVAHALEGIEGDYISSTLTAVRKFLKQHIKDGTTAGKECEACGSDQVIYEGGCDRCLSCGNSGCA